VGLGERSVRVEDLDTAQQQIVAALYSGIVEGQQDAIDDAVSACKGQTASLIELLKPLIYDHQAPKTQTWDSIAFAEIARTSLDYEVNGEMVLAERSQRNVHIDQLDKTGLLLAKALIGSGVGKVISHDDGVVLNTDIGELGYPPKYLGTSRHKATSQIIRELSNWDKERIFIAIEGRKIDYKISFAVTVGHLALSPRTYSRWLNRDVHHIAISFGLQNTHISPVIVPGLTPCLNCYQESLVDEDESWPIIASQLLDLPRMRNDSAALLTATGLSVRSILRNLDEQAGFLSVKDTSHEYSQGYLVDYASGNITRSRYDFHKLCSCVEAS